MHHKFLFPMADGHTVKEAIGVHPRALTTITIDFLAVGCCGSVKLRMGIVRSEVSARYGRKSRHRVRLCGSCSVAPRISATPG